MDIAILINMTIPLYCPVRDRYTLKLLVSPSILQSLGFISTSAKTIKTQKTDQNKISRRLWKTKCFRKWKETSNHNQEFILIEVCFGYHINLEDW